MLILEKHINKLYGINTEKFFLNCPAVNSHKLCENSHYAVEL